jgi:hypothetical protein
LRLLADAGDDIFHGSTPLVGLSENQSCWKWASVASTPPMLAITSDQGSRKGAKTPRGRFIQE